MSKPDPSDKRRLHIAFVLRYLRTEFPNYDVAPFPAEYRIKVREIGGAQVIHEVAFHMAFLDDHDDPVKEVRRRGLVQRMKEKGSETVWVNTREVS